MRGKKTNSPWIFIAFVISFSLAGHSSASGYGEDGKIFKQHLKEAKRGNIESQRIVSDMYFEGHGVDKNPIEGRRWLERAADGGSLDAKFDLGIIALYMQPSGPDCDIAVNTFTKLAEVQFTKAEFQIGWMNEYGECFQKDINAAIIWYEKSASRPDESAADAAFRAGYHRYLGKDGVTKDYKKAEEFFQKAASSANFVDRSTAIYYLGIIYKEGHGVDKNEIKALRLLCAASTMGINDSEGLIDDLVRRIPATQLVNSVMEMADSDGGRAARLLSDIYENPEKFGSAVEKNSSLARKYRIHAANTGDGASQAILAYRYFTGTGMPQVHSEAFKYALKAARKGYGLSQCILGVLYFTGGGGDVNYSRAHFWSILAAANGQDQEPCKSIRFKSQVRLYGAELERVGQIAVSWKPSADEENYSPEP